MGLDMYAFAVKDAPQRDIDFLDLDFLNQESWPHELLCQWRKHGDLNEWMRRLYLAKGGTAQQYDYDASSLRLDAIDLDRLENDIRHDALPHVRVEAAWYYEPDCVSFRRDKDLAFIAKARQAISDGQTVVYVPV